MAQVFEELVRWNVVSAESELERYAWSSGGRELDRRIRGPSMTSLSKSSLSPSNSPSLWSRRAETGAEEGGEGKSSGKSGIEMVLVNAPFDSCDSPRGVIGGVS
mgnify:CR=1 FL=1